MHKIKEISNVKVCKVYLLNKSWADKRANIAIKEQSNLKKKFEKESPQSKYLDFVLKYNF